MLRIAYFLSGEVCAGNAATEMAYLSYSQRNARKQVLLKNGKQRLLPSGRAFRKRKEGKTGEGYRDAS